MSSRALYRSLALAVILSHCISAAGQSISGERAARLWTDHTGQRHAMATLLSFDGDSVRLRREQGGKIVVMPLTAFSEEDQNLIRRTLKPTPPAFDVYSVFPTLQALPALLDVTKLLPRQIVIHRALTAWQHMVNGWKMPGMRLPEMVAPAIDTATTVANEIDVRLPTNIVYVRLSKSFLDRYFSRKVDRESQVRDHILGAAVFGTAHTLGETKLVLRDAKQHAQAELQLVGANTFTSNSYQGPIRISSQGVTQFTSRKLIQIDARGVHQELPTTVATNHTTTTGVSSSLPGIRGRIATRIGTRKERESHSTAERISAEHTRDAITREFDKWVAEEMANFTANFKAQIGRLENLRYDKDFAVKEVRCSTTLDTLQIVLFALPKGEPHYVDAPPSSPDRPEIEIQLHTSLMKKACVDPIFRDTLQSAIEQLVTRKAMRLVKNSRHQDSRPDFDVKWTEDLSWMTLTWHLKPDSQSATNDADLSASR